MSNRPASLFVLALAALLLISGNAISPALSASAPLPPKKDWSFTGFLGTFDRAQMQRGLQVYTEVCAACHGLDLFRYRELAHLGYSPEQIKSFAAGFEVTDGPNDDGEMFLRPALPQDAFVNPYPNDNAARAANGGAYPVDLSLIVKARAQGDAGPVGFAPNFIRAMRGRGYAAGADYLVALLTGYDDPPADFDLLDGLYYNNYYAGNQIAMPQPLYEDSVEYADGTPATIEQMSEDVAAFLTFVSEPAYEQRRALGLRVVAFLAFFAVVMLLVKRRIWAKAGH